MKKIQVVKNNSVLSSATFEDPTAWLAEGVAANWWGLPERPELDAEGNPTGNTLPAEYTIEIEDITAQLENERINAEAAELSRLAEVDMMTALQTATGIDADYTTHLMIVAKNQDIAMNLTGDHSEAEILEAKAVLAVYRGLFTQIEAIRAARDAAIANLEAAE